MASDDVNIAEDAEMADYDGDKVVTMMDVLQEQQEFEDDANAVLGASDDKNCTYPKGYIKRQALYACLTCCTEAKTDPTKRAGVCLACSLTCHENHELIELYTKRNFRCDCGNPKFNTHPCQFTSTKDDLNEGNIYNQNFSGLYCTCHRPYPDLDSTFEDDMIQCIICEDWLHASHLEATVPANDQYSEMVCKGCMEKNEFLHDYTGFAVNLENGEVDIITVNGDAKSADNSLCNGDLEKEKLVNGDDNNKTEIKATCDIKLNSDVEMNDDSEKSEESSEVTENTTSEPSEEPKGEKSSDMETTEPKLNQTESEEEQTKETTDEPIENDDITTKTDEPNATENKVQDAQAGDKADLIEAAQNEDKTNDNATTENIKTEKMDNATKEHSETENVENAKDVTATEEQNKEQSTSVDQGKSDNTTESHVKSEQLSDNEKDEPSGEKPVDVPDKETNVGGETTKSEDLKENSEDKSDSVMDAIDEILDARNDDTKQENKDDVSASTAPKENTESIDTKASDDVEMASIENKVDDNVSECTDKSKEAEDKTGITVEMSDSTEQDKPQPPTEIKIEPESTDASKVVDSIAASTDVKTIDENKVEETSEEAKPSEVEATEMETEKSSTVTEEKVEETTKDSSENETKELSDKDNEAAEVKENTSEHKRKLSVDVTEDVSSKKAKLEADCVRPRGVKRVHKGATFWPSTFRQKLCTCGECISMYNDLNVLFLTDLEDTVSAYESLGKANAGGASQYEKGLEALSSLDRIQQINALTEYNKMRDKLLDFLKSFKDRKEIVKEEDIKAFFAGMKPRREPDGVYFCR